MFSVDRILKTTSGGLKFCDTDNFLYRLDYASNSRFYWKCCVAGRKARAKTEAMNHESPVENLCIINSHPHSSNPVELTTVRLKDTFDTQVTTRSVVSNFVQSISKPLKIVIPSNESLSRIVRRLRASNEMTQPNPNSSHGFEIPDKYSRTPSGENFLIIDSGVEDHSRFFIYGSDTGEC